MSNQSWGETFSETEKLPDTPFCDEIQQRQHVGLDVLSLTNQQPFYFMNVLLSLINMLKFAHDIEFC